MFVCCVSCCDLVLYVSIVCSRCLFFFFGVLVLCFGLSCRCVFFALCRLSIASSQCAFVLRFRIVC